MQDQDNSRKLRELRQNIRETGIRIRRYTLDPQLKRFNLDQPWKKKPSPDTSEGVPSAGTPEPAEELRKMANKAWDDWAALSAKLNGLSSSATSDQLAEIEKAWLRIDRDVDLLQRELISSQSSATGVRVALTLAGVLILLAALYLYTHNVRSFNFTQFEPWPEWGPMKYGEVLFWSSFGAVSWLLFLATWYLKRRDFDDYYKTWYLSTGLRAPFLSLISMVIILEFTEWWGEGSSVGKYLLEEGNKFYFIVLVSFCLGLSSDRTSSIVREFAGAVGDFLEQAVGRISKWMRNFGPPSLLAK